MIKNLKKGKRFAGSYGRVRIRKVKMKFFITRVKEEIEIKNTSTKKKLHLKRK